MMATETIYVHRVCNSQIVKTPDRRPFCEICNRPANPNEISEVDNSPSPFAG